MIMVNGVNVNTDIDSFLSFLAEKFGQDVDVKNRYRTIFRDNSKRIHITVCIADYSLDIEYTFENSLSAEEFYEKYMKYDTMARYCRERDCWDCIFAMDEDTCCMTTVQENMKKFS